MLKLTPVLQPPDSKLLFSRSLVFDSLWPHGLQHARLLSPLLFPRVCSNSCPLSLWYYPIISSCLPLLLLSIFPSIKVFPSESALHIGGQSIEASASASVLPMNIQGWFPLALTGLICMDYHKSFIHLPDDEFEIVSRGHFFSSINKVPRIFVYKSFCAHWFLLPWG